jgi:hypothetical protein
LSLIRKSKSKWASNQKYIHVDNPYSRPACITLFL